MAWSAPIKLRPLAADVAISRACLRVASPPVARPLRVVTWLADEKIMLGAVGVFWAATRFSPSRPLRREADQMLCSVLIAGMVPDLFKYLVRRERPNRALVLRHDTRVPRLGNTLDSFPSGHAAHLGAIAGSAQRLVPKRWRAAMERARRARRDADRAACALSERRSRRLGHRRFDQQSGRGRVRQGRTFGIKRHSRGNATAAVLDREQTQAECQLEAKPVSPSPNLLPAALLVCSVKGTSARSHELVARRPAAAGPRSHEL